MAAPKGKSKMAIPTLEELKQDNLVMSVARALALANEAAESAGWDPSKLLVTITEEPEKNGGLWRIHYGPRDYINRRGGDLVVIVDERAGVVHQVIRGQ
jgi:hypothetical protein